LEGYSREMSADERLNIGALANAVGVGRETIRFYERRGLVPAPPRSSAGYRRYPADTVGRIRFIRRAQQLGFSLSEISELLELCVSHASVCGEVEANARAKLDQVEGKIEELARIGDSLRDLVTRCQSREVTGECPILEELGHDESAG